MEWAGYTAIQLEEIRKLLRSNKSKDYFSENYEVDDEDVRERKVAFGHVKKVRCVHSEWTFAVKTVAIQGMRRGDNVQDEKRYAREVLQAFYEAVFGNQFDGHDNIVTAYPNRHWVVLPDLEEQGEDLVNFLEGENSISIDLLKAFAGTEIFMVFDWYEYDLRSLLPTKVKDETILVILRDQIAYILIRVAIALGFLHDNDIVHGDIRQDNILLNKDEITGDITDVVVADFGLSKCLKDFIFEHGGGGHPFYCYAPEKQLTKGFDIWSFGNVLFACLMLVATAQSVKDGKWSTFKAYVLGRRYDELRRFLDDEMPYEDISLKELIVQCLQWDPGDRPNPQVLQFVLSKDRIVEDALKAANHLNKDFQITHPAQMMFSNFVRRLLELSDNEKVDQRLPPEVAQIIRSALEQQDPFPARALYQNCDAIILRDLARFSADTSEHSLDSLHSSMYSD